MTGFLDYCEVMKFRYDGLAVLSCSSIAVEKYIHRYDVDDKYTAIHSQQIFPYGQWSPTSTIRVFDRLGFTIRTSDVYLVNINVSKTVVI